MLRIQCMSREELIKHLTEMKGVVPPNVCIISINDPGQQELIGDEGKTNVLSVVFQADFYGADLLTIDIGIAIFKFIGDNVKEIMQNNANSILIVQSTEGISRAGSVAAFAFEYLAPYNLIDSEWFLMKNLTMQSNRLILEKLYTVKNLLEHFDDQMEKLPYLAYKILQDPSQTALHESCNNYLNNMFNVEIKRMKESYPYLKMVAN